MEREKYEGTCFYLSGADCSIEKVSTFKLEFLLFFYSRTQEHFLHPNCYGSVPAVKLLLLILFSQQFLSKKWDLWQSASAKATHKSAVGPEVKKNTREMRKMSRQWEVIIWSLWLRQSVDPREMPHSYVGVTSRCLPSCRLLSWTIYPYRVSDDVPWQFPQQQQNLSPLPWGGQMEKTILWEKQRKERKKERKTNSVWTSHKSIKQTIHNTVHK